MADRTFVSRSTTVSNRLPTWFPPRPQFYAPLRTSVFNTYGKGLTTYSRASVATVFDHEGIMRDVLSGEVRFQGARRVQNIYTYSQDLSNAVWTAVSCVRQSNVTTAPDGTPTGDRVQTNASTAMMEMFQNLDVVAGKTYTYSAYVKYHNWRYIQLVGNGLAFGIGYINIDIQTGTIISTTAWAGNFSGTITSVGNGWYRVSATATCISTLAAQHISIAFINNASDVRMAPAVWDGTSGYYVWGMQMEDVTTQSVKTPWDYVSTNVMLAPFYHGACVDGVKYFDTKVDGTPIPETTIKGFYSEGARTNLFFESKNIDATSWTKAGWVTTIANQVTWPDASLTMAKITSANSTASQYVGQSITTTATNYAMSFYLKMGNHRYVQFRAWTTISNGYVNFDLQTGTVGSSSLWTGYIENVWNGIYRCCIATEAVLAATNVFLCAFANTLTDTRWVAFVGTGTEYFYASHAQLETSDMATTYIDCPSTVAVTRAADVLNYENTNVQTKQGSTTIQWWLPDPIVKSGVTRRILLYRLGGNDRLQILWRNNTIGQALVNYGTGTGIQTVASSQSTNPNLNVNFGMTWENGSYVNLFCNNEKNSGTSPVPAMNLNLIDVGGSISGATHTFNGCVKQLRIWKEIVSDTDMFKLTSTNI